MSYQEYIDSRGSVLYWTPPKEHQNNSDRVLGMDLDFTIIRPIKGKIFPVDKHDWQFLGDLTPIQKYINSGGYKFVIFTNQAGLASKKTGNMDIEDFKSRWENDIYPKLKTDYQISSVYLIVALYDDFFRKPTTGMWDFMETHLNGDIRVNRQESLYIGDMAGRKGDHSYSDLMFAVNLGVPFSIPEAFYGSKISEADPTTVKLIKNMEMDPKIFNPFKYIAELDKTTRKKLIEDNKKVSSQIKKIISDLKTRYLIIYVGSQASGKSSFLNNYMDIDAELSKNFIYMSQDKFPGTPAKFIKTISQNISIGKQHIIIDNTNGTRKTREKLIKLVSGSSNYKTAVIHFTTPKDVVMHLNAIRTKENNACSLLKLHNPELECELECDDIHNVPAVAIHTYWKHFELPDKDLEGFDELYKIDFNPLDHNNKHFLMLL